MHQYILMLLTKYNHSHAYVNPALGALKFLMINIFQLKAMTFDIPRCKEEQKLLVIMSRSDVIAVLELHG